MMYNIIKGAIIMIITFFGHTEFTETKAIEDKIYSILDNINNNEQIDFYLGGYGRFDLFAYACAKKYKETHKNVKLIFVTPYISEKYINKRTDEYDEIIYPPLENKPNKYAILYRNQWMIKESDIVIVYVKYSVGGAYTAYTYAERIGKNTINLAI